MKLGISGFYDRILPVMDKDGGRSGGNDEDKDDDAGHLQGLLRRHNNDAMAMSLTLSAENAELRADRRKDRATIKLLEGKIPSEGTVVLSGDDAKLWARYKELGSPEDIDKLRTERDELKSKVAGIEAEGPLKAVADLGWNFDILKDLGKSLEFKVDEVTVDGQRTKVAMIKKGDQFIKLEDYAKENWKPYLPALRVTASEQGDEEAVIENSDEGSTTGAPWISQHGGRSSGSGSRRASDPVGDMLRHSYGGKNLPFKRSNSEASRS